MAATYQKLTAKPIHRFSDGNSEYLLCSGGFRAGKIDNEHWAIEPTLKDRIAVSLQPLSSDELRRLIFQYKFNPIGIHRSGWSDGEYHSDWRPILTGRDTNLRGPSDLWRSIALNHSRVRTDGDFDNNPNMTAEEIENLLDSRPREEFLAHAISLSLRSMDISVEQIAEFYHEQLTNLLASGRLAGVSVGTALDQVLYTHIHSFFLHLGSARDYLGSYIASKIGLNSKELDSMKLLIGRLRHDSFGINPVLDLVRNKGYLELENRDMDKWVSSGWLRAATEIRNQLVHRRPYGTMLIERFGSLVTLCESQGIYRYFRPIHHSSGTKDDVFDTIILHYQKCMELFMEAAECSAENTEMITIKDDDIVDLKLR